MAVLTRKFSEFPAGTLDEAVGLASNTNTRGPNGGGGSGISQTIVQPNNFNPGEWIRFDEATNLYVRAISTTPLNAEVIGVVISPFNAAQFTLQQAGYITAAQNVFAGPFTPGVPQYLSDTVAGGMMATDVTIDGEVSRPIFLPDGARSGWVLPYRGIIEGGGDEGTGGGTSTVTDSNVVTVNQIGHGLNAGQWIRIETPTVGPNQVQYVLAAATSLQNSQSVGVVIERIDANNFRYQFAGYVRTNLATNTTAPFQDVSLANLVPSTVYYLSTTPGFITSVDPGLTGGFSKPLFISEQTIGTVVANAGIILPQRPIGPTAPPPPSTPTLVATPSGSPFETTATGWVDTGICATITTANALQRVLILGSLNLASDGSSGVAYRVVRNGVPIDIGDAAGTRERAGGGSLGQPASLDSGISVFDAFYDTPGAAGIYTYCFQVNRGASSIVGVNRSTSNTDPDTSAFFRTASTILLWIV